MSLEGSDISDISDISDVLRRHEFSSATTTEGSLDFISSISLYLAQRHDKHGKDSMGNESSPAMICTNQSGDILESGASMRLTFRWLRGWYPITLLWIAVLALASSHLACFLHSHTPLSKLYTTCNTPPLLFLHNMWGKFCCLQGVRHTVHWFRRLGPGCTVIITNMMPYANHLDALLIKMFV